MNCSSGSEPGCADGLGDEVGDDARRRTPPRRGAAGSTIASSSSVGDSGASTYEPGADELADRRVLERPVEQVGADRGHDADVAGSSSSAVGDDVEEAVAASARRPGPALLELVDDQHHAAEPTGDVGERVDGAAGSVDVRRGGDLGERRMQRADRDRRPGPS